MGLERLLEINPEVYAIDAEFIDETIKNLKLDKNSKILEIGTGFGTMTTILALNDFNVLTGEPEHACHHDWRKAAKAFGVDQKIRYQYLDTETFTIHVGAFDAIFIHLTLEHIEKKELALKQCLKVLKPNGMIVIIEHNEKGIKYFQNTMYQSGVPPHPLDPRDIITRDDGSINVIRGNYVDFYLLRKKVLSRNKTRNN
ncbi:MAG: class I SAM-dependent methyltransferase [Candidatus Hodarchaeales archaeon]